MLSVLGLLLIIGSLLRRQDGGSSSYQGSPNLPTAGTTPGDTFTPPLAAAAPVPFPQAVPSDLPSFPAGWEYDQPPSHDAVVRAWQLVDPLWSQGAGATKTEQTAGRWQTYRAELMSGGTKGVAVYRVRGAPSANPPVAVPSTMPAAQAAPPPVYQAPPVAVPASYPVTTPASSPAMTTREIQQALNNAGASPALATDGLTGPKTTAAVVAFQRAHGLAADGNPGPLTQAALRPFLAMPAAPAPKGPAPAPWPTAIPAAYPVTPAAAPPAPAASSPGMTLTVLQLQQALNNAGASPLLVTDGIAGPKTTSAVIAFQHAHGLSPDGKPGPLTQAALAPYLTAGPAPVPAAAVPVTYVSPTPPASSPAPIVLTAKQLQQALNNAGASPPLVTDGIAGAKTTAAVVAFQRSHGLSPDGKPGPLTQAALAPFLAVNS